MTIGRPRSLYIHDDLYLPLSEALAARGISVSAWFREQARAWLAEYDGSGQHDGSAPVFYAVPEHKEWIRDE